MISEARNCENIVENKMTLKSMWIEDNISIKLQGLENMEEGDVFQKLGLIGHEKATGKG